MRCPSCGFENMPGIKKCTLCSKDIETVTTRERMYPTRAHERSFWQRAIWSIRSRRDSVSDSQAKTPRRHPGLFMMTPSEYSWAFASIFPGVGHICILGMRSAGIAMLIGFLAALFGMGILYKTTLSNYIAYAIFAESVYSVYSVTAYFCGGKRSGMVRFAGNVGIALMVVSAYLLGYAILRFMVAPYANIARVTGNTNIPSIALGDSVFIGSVSHFKRGEIVVDTEGDHLLGSIVGMPGDRVSLSDRVYINYAPTAITYTPTGGEEGHLGSASAAVVLAKDQYWIQPMPGTSMTDSERWIQSGIVYGQTLQHAVAIVGPPNRRRLIEQP